MSSLLITAATEFLCPISACSYLGYQIFKDHLINFLFYLFIFLKAKYFCLSLD